MLSGLVDFGRQMWAGRRVPSLPAPKAAVAPVQPRASLHEIAQMQRRLKKFVPTSEHINSIMQSNGNTIVRRARSLCATNPYAISGREIFTSYLVGKGVRITSTLEDKDARREVNEAWEEWCEESDAHGVQSLCGQMSLIGPALFQTGEMFFRRRPRRLSDGLSVPLQLQALEAEYLDRTFTQALPNGHQIKSGIEFNRINQRVAYHFWRTHPGDSQTLLRSIERVRVPASEVIHVFDQIDSDQIRGVPRVVGGLIRLFLLGEYDDAELDRKKVAALIAGFITTPHDEDMPAGIPGAEDVDANADGVADIEWQPGTLNILRPGEGIEFSDPADVGGNYEVFRKANLLAVCAAFGTPYSQTTGDFSAANYSSERAAQVAFRRRMEPLIEKMVIHQFCRPVWHWWTEAARLSGAISGDLRTLRRRRKYTPPRWEWVDPKKDLEAEKIAVENGWKSDSDVIEAIGNDTEGTYERIASDTASRQAKGITLGRDQKPAASSAEPVEMEDDESTDSQKQRGAA